MQGKPLYKRAVNELKKIGLDKAQMDYIDVMMDSFPEAYTEHFSYVVEKGEGNAQLRAEKIGEMKTDAKHVLTLYEKSSDVGDFLEGFGRFAADRLLKRGEAKKYFPDAKGNWKDDFGKSFAEWHLDRMSKPAGLTKIFNRILKAVKAIYLRFQGYKNTNPALETIFEDLATGKRDIESKAFESPKEKYELIERVDRIEQNQKEFYADFKKQLLRIEMKLEWKESE